MQFLPHVVHRCDVCHLSLKKERKLCVCGKEVVIKIDGPKRDEVTDE